MGKNHIYRSFKSVFVFPALERARSNNCHKYFAVLLTVNFKRSGHFVGVGLGGDHASVVELAVLDDQLPLLALGHDLDPRRGQSHD